MDFPVSALSLTLTENCNLRCSYCFTGGCGGKNMDSKVGKAAIDFFGTQPYEKDQGNSITWWGGEPLLRMDLIKELWDYAQEFGERTGRVMTYTGTTNGILHTPEVCDWLVEHKSPFMFSIDSNKKLHDKHRVRVNGEGSWDEVIDNFKYFVEKFPIAACRFSMLPEAVYTLYDDVMYMVEELKCTHVVTSPVCEMPWTPEDFAELERQATRIVEYWNKQTAEKKRFIFHPVSIYTERSRGGSEYPCGAGRSFLAVSADGSLYPCHRFDKFHGFGEFSHPGLWKIGDVFNGITKPHIRQPFIGWPNRVLPPKCVTCAFKHVCNGTCYATSFDSSGFITEPSPVHCQYTKVLSKVAQNLVIPGMGDRKSCICFNVCYSEHCGLD